MLKDINVDSLLPRDPVALDKGGRSNCYMVIASDEPQAYSFHAQKILGDTFDLAKTATAKAIGTTEPCPTFQKRTRHA